MSEQIQKEVLARLDALAAKLGVAAQALWALFVRQSLINGVECLLVAVVAGCMSTWLWQRGRSLMEKEDAKFAADMAAFNANTTHSYPEIEDHAFWYFVPAVVLVGLAIVLTVNSIDLLGNPQFWAFKDLVNAIKQ